jgi:hypothetical protein
MKLADVAFWHSLTHALSGTFGGRQRKQFLTLLTPERA